MFFVFLYSLLLLLDVLCCLHRYRMLGKWWCLYILCWFWQIDLYPVQDLCWWKFGVVMSVFFWLYVRKVLFRFDSDLMKNKIVTSSATLVFFLIFMIAWDLSQYFLSLTFRWRFCTAILASLIIIFPAFTYVLKLDDKVCFL